MPAKKLVILGNPRSGSTLLQKGLGLHLGGLVYSELFHPELGERAMSHFIDYGNRGRTYYPGLDCDAIEFLKFHVWNERNLERYDFVGFKRFAESIDCPGSKNFYNRLEEFDDIHYLHIKRENLFESYVSLTLAKLTKRWVDEAYFDKDAELEKIYINPDDVLNYFEIITSNDRFFYQKFSNQKYLEVKYNDLSSKYKPTIKKIFKFLDVDALINDPPIKKQNKNRSSDIVKNYTDLKIMFSNSDYGSFFNE